MRTAVRLHRRWGELAPRGCVHDADGRRSPRVRPQGLEPENIDKEFLRLWFKERCDPYTADPLPEAPAELVTELSSR